MNTHDTLTTRERIKNLALATSRAKGGRREELEDELRFAMRQMSHLTTCFELPSHIRTEAL